MDTSTSIPENVLETLKAIRDSGKTNMLIRTRVVALAWEHDPGAAQWLEDHRSDFHAALWQMVEYAAKTESK